VKLGGTLKEKCSNITVTLDPVESKVIYTLAYRCYCGPFWKRSEPTFTLHLLLWASL